jgi:pSer/pThr/pTyr-binding forkhead associated (FHA) protein
MSDPARFPRERRLNVVLREASDEASDAALPEFTPLRLTLQPGGLYLDLNKAEVVLGRHSQADVRLPLPDVSRRHCRLFWADGVWRVCDLHSLNGTLVNGQRVEETSLHPGDTLRIGGFTFAISWAAAPESTAPFAEAQNANTDILRGIADALPSTDAEQLPRRRAS